MYKVFRNSFGIAHTHPHIHTHTHTHTYVRIDLLVSHRAPPQLADRGKLVRYEGYRENKISGADQN